MSPNTMFMLVAFMMTSSLALLVLTLMSGGATRLNARLDVLAGKANSTNDRDSVVQFARSALPKMAAPLVPEDEGQRTLLRTRLVHAGLYHKQAMYVFLGVKMLAIVSPVIIGVAIGLLGLVPIHYGAFGGLACGIFGMILPSFWLDWMKGKRQTSFRRSLPDALDVLVICLEGGLSLPSALKRVANELRAVHPILANELQIVDREIQLGRTAGESLWHMAERTGLEEILSLSGVITQADRFGASLVRSLRVHADTLRLKRQQHAEEMAQKAGTKILMPTLLFIFPAIFVVILGPATIQVMDMFSKMNN